MRENRRLIKINEEIKRELNEIVNYRLKDPRVNGLITISKVDTTNDLKYSTIYVSIYNVPEEEKKAVLEAIVNSKGFIRKEIAREINLRITPELNFKLDTTLDYASHMEEIFNKIKKEEKGSNE